MKRKILNILLMLPLALFGLVGCSSDYNSNSVITNNNAITDSNTITDSNENVSVLAHKTVDLMSDINYSDNITTVDVANKNTTLAVSNFVIDMYKQIVDLNSSNNTMISPVSIINALAMTSNGAVGETLEEMENVFGVSSSELSSFIKYYNELLNQNKSNKINLANSIWFKDSQRFEIKSQFLQHNKDYFDADIYKASFDNETLNDINNWVSENTDNMIDNIITEVPENAIMYLINAITFDAEWEEIYKENNIHEGEFFNVDGTISVVEFMASEEQKLIELKSATGFIKNYKNNEYSFVGLLPNSNFNIVDVVDELSKIDVITMIDNANIQDIDVILPKFSLEYSIELPNILQKMGITTAFDSNNADFSNLAVGDGNIFIGNILHKTYINVDEKGTQAGAATVVEMIMKMAMPMYKMELRFNQPFVYIIIDNTNNIPLFIGNMNILD